MGQLRAVLLGDRTRPRDVALMPRARFVLRMLGAIAFASLLVAAFPALANTPAIELANLDRTCAPCEDFVRFATGGWTKTHELPPGRSRWGAFTELARDNRATLRTLLEAAAKNERAPAASDEQKLGAYYRACMDEEAIERAGLAPVAALLDAVDAVHDLPSLTSAIATVERAGVDAGLPFGARSDAKDSSRQMAGIAFGGLGLPDRDYYQGSDQRSTRIRSEYHTYVATQLGNLGTEPLAAEGAADDVVALETALAAATPRRADLRDPVRTNNPTAVAELPTLAPHLPWETFFGAFDPPPFTVVNVRVPAFLTAYDALLAETPLDTWKAYLRFHVTDAYSSALPKRFDDASFAFRSGVLLGVSERLPRGERCATATDTALRDLLSKAFITQRFPPAAKARAELLVDNLQAVLNDQILALDWMSPETKARAVEKLRAMTKKIAYPERWEDYSGLQVGNGPYAANVVALRRWNDARDIARIGKPTDRRVWGMTAATVNAYYSPSNNEIVFPAGILAPPFFNLTADDAVNYGAIGAVIGHEMTHAFDDQGRQFNRRGDLDDWWRPDDAREFRTHAQCIVDQFDEYEVAPGTFEQGRLVQGEAIADLGGLTIAYRAFERTAQFKAHKKIDGFTPEQRFFISFAQLWRQIQTEQATRQQARTDPHPDGRFRVIGTLSNLPEFQSAFACALTDKMVRAKRCRVW
jgi:putative endopeptidase